jgi:isopentenyl diphosphate isomerase/L-lactate dehydrogenase-like FMN-dependent dehydrogenase
MMGRPVLPKATADLARIVEYTPLKVVLKGVMTPDDAKRAVDAGAAGIVVSNHGGRVIDHLPGTAEVLPDIAEAVKGQITILVDGGIRSGADVVKMLALGADAAMIGRPFSWATLGGGREGVQLFLKKLIEEFFIAMIVTGCQSVADIDESVLFNRP